MKTSDQESVYKHAIQAQDGPVEVEDQCAISKTEVVGQKKKNGVSACTFSLINAA